MGNCKDIMKKFHNEVVKLGEVKRKELKEQAESHRKCIKDGLEDSDYPQPKEFISQGSYAMRTLVMRPNKNYDIDDGVYFEKDSLRGKKPELLREFIKDILSKKNFGKDPKVMKNCIRTFYKDGHHIDVPVYRIDEEDKIQLATDGNKWIDSDPQKVTEWFLNEHKKQDNLRTIVRLLKYFSIGKPNGLTISCLVIEQINLLNGDFDDVLHAVIKHVEFRLADSLAIEHPVMPGEFLSLDGDERMNKFQQKIKKAVECLAPLDSLSCSKEEALKAWDKVFKCSFFIDSCGTSSSGNGGKSTVIPLTKPWLQV